MNISKVSTKAGFESRKMDFIKYTNYKSSEAGKLSVFTDCFNNSVIRENHLIQLNFTA